MEVCRKCCSVKLDVLLSSNGICELCGCKKRVFSTYVFEDEVDRLYYIELGGEG
ncbi:MAG: hypothetical protein ACJAT2_003420 [Bacteriovoracaceae bacterium]|jgi:hypothetical protein